MLDDLNAVNFRSIQEQASWVCHCDDSKVQLLEAHFKKSLYQQNPLDLLAAWLKVVAA
jgi:hypothetical protein